MRAYLRPDGRYDLFPDTVEPEVISAEEYESLKHREELEKRKAELLAELKAIDNELLPQPTPAEVAPASTPAPQADVTANAETPVIRKRW